MFDKSSVKELQMRICASLMLDLSVLLPVSVLHTSVSRRESVHEAAVKRAEASQDLLQSVRWDKDT